MIRTEDFSTLENQTVELTFWDNKDKEVSQPQSISGCVMRDNDETLPIRQQPSFNGI